jgi:hypothetical protein
MHSTEGRSAAGLPPGVSEALDDPIVRALMAADRTEPACVAQLMRRVAERLSKRTFSPEERRSS